jgi:hypothetical protein
MSPVSLSDCQSVFDSAAGNPRVNCLTGAVHTVYTTTYQEMTAIALQRLRPLMIAVCVLHGGALAIPVDSVYGIVQAMTGSSADKAKRFCKKSLGQQQLQPAFLTPSILAVHAIPILVNRFAETQLLTSETWSHVAAGVKRVAIPFRLSKLL